MSVSRHNCIEKRDIRPFLAHLGLDYERQSLYQFHILAIDSTGLNSSVPVTIRVHNRNDFCPELLKNSTVLFFNTDRWNSYLFDLYDGDNDTCQMDLLTFNEIFHLQPIKRNQYVLYAHRLPEREYYILQLRLRDLVNESIDHSCIRTVQFVVTTGTNDTNQTVAMELADDYLQALHRIERHSSSSFHLTIVHVILTLIFLSLAVLIALLAMKFVCHSSKRRHPTGALYRLQGPTETQLPLLDNEPGEQSLIVSSHRLTADEQQQKVDMSE